MWTVALSQLRTQPRRYVSVVLAILIGTLFLAASFLVSSSAQATLRSTLGSTYAAADLVVLPSGDLRAASSGEAGAPSFATLAGTPDRPGELGRVPGVAEAHATQLTWTEAQAGTERFTATALPAPRDASLTAVRVTEGSLPSPADPRGVALDAATAQRRGVHVGDAITLGGGSAGGRAEATVVGLTTASPDPMLSSGAQVWAGAPLLTALNTTGTGGAEGAGATTEPYTPHVLLRLAPGADRDAVAAAATDVLRARGVAADVSTPDAAVRRTLAESGGGTDVFGWVLGAFAVLALLVTALVIANTFQVLVAQRTRDLALLRTLGATAGQVRGSVVAEALVVGLAGAVLGAGLAVALTAAGTAVVREAFDVSTLAFAVDPLGLAIAVAVGTAVTVAASLAPALAATRVAPLQALRPADEVTVRSRGGVARTVLGALLAVGGTALMLWGAFSPAPVAAIGGGVLSFLGVLMLAALFVPAAVRGAAVLARPAGVPGRLAGLNATRHRSRTAATAAALLIGTTLVALFLTGGRTAQHTTDAALDSVYPVDLVVSVPAGTDAAAAADRVRAVADVEAAATALPVGTTEKGTPVLAVPAAGLRAVVAGLPQEEERRLGERGGVLVPAHVDAAEVRATVAGTAQSLAPVKAGSLGSGAYVTEETARAAGWDGRPVAGPGGEADAQLLVALRPGVAPGDMQGLAEAVTGAVGVGSSSVLGGGAPERAVYAQVIDAMLWIVVALLAVSVLIALIGVANTLSLSVIERTRENALLRALGLTRGGLRGMIAIEAVLIAAVAALLGCALGVFYGWAGSQLILGDLLGEITGRNTVVPTVPWAELALVVAVAAAAGLAASLLPARRAARLSPVEGLAAV